MKMKRYIQANREEINTVQNEKGSKSIPAPLPELIKFGPVLFHLSSLCSDSPSRLTGSGSGCWSI